MFNDFFNPASIALIGATDDATKIGGKVMNTLMSHQYAGQFYPVNKSKTSIGGWQAYPSVEDIPGSVDLALIAIPARTVPGVLEECARSGIKGAIIFSSGFSEEGAEGADLQRQIEEICRRTGIRVNGPNSEGFFNASTRVAATFSPAINVPLGQTPGKKVGIVAQSGGLGFAVFNRGRQRNMDFSHIVSVGNQVDLELSDYVDFFLSDPETHAIVMYAESFRRPRRFIEVASRAAELGKPLIIAKVGRSRAGQRAAASHTGALASSVRVCDAVLAHHGVLRADDQDELLDVAAAFALAKRMRGNRVAIVSTSGGTAVWLTDACEAAGLEVPPLDDAVQARLAKFIPSYGSTANPVDITAQGVNAYAQSMQVLADDDSIDAIIIASSFAHDTRLKNEGKAMARLARDMGKPVLFYSYTLPSESSSRILAQLGLYCYTSITGCARALQALLEYSRFQESRTNRHAPPIGQPAPLNAQALLAVDEPSMCEYEAKALLAAFDIQVPAEILARTPEDAVQAAERLGFPVALKIQSPHIPHKTEANGVILNLGTARAVQQAAEQLLRSASTHAPQADIHGILVQPMGQPGVEVMAGIINDADFGPMVLVGMGGVFVEVLQDSVLAPAPLTRATAEHMIRSLKGFPLLSGVRGQPPCDIDALCDLLVKLSVLAATASETLSELDINPLFVHARGEGLTIVDALGVRRKTT